MDNSIDFAASLLFGSALSAVLGAFGIASLVAGRPLVATRVLREAPLPIVGRAPMHAVAWALLLLSRGLAALRISANAISISALMLAVLAAIAFAHGHFGVAAVIAAASSLADGLDGAVARITHTESRFGRVLDTTIDRFVDALFLGGIAIYVRTNVMLLVITITAIVGAFFTSYASSIEREIGVTGHPSTMRRAHRLAYVVVGSACAPIVAGALDDARAALIPVFAAVGAIAVIGNVSAIRRLFAATRAAPVHDEDATIHDDDSTSDVVPNSRLETMDGFGR